tara:strand:- start:314 stop:751 length:438 start_codon:yes stop_codon:yes gene_type:complete
MAKTKAAKRDMQTEKFDEPELLCDPTNFSPHNTVLELEHLDEIIRSDENYDFEKFEIIEAYTYFKKATFTKKDLEKFIEMKDQDAFDKTIFDQINEQDNGMSEQDSTYAYRVLRKVPEDEQVEYTNQIVREERLNNDNFFKPRYW